MEGRREKRGSGDGEVVCFELVESSYCTGRGCGQPEESRLAQARLAEQD